MKQLVIGVRPGHPGERGLRIHQGLSPYLVLPVENLGDAFPHLIWV